MRALAPRWLVAAALVVLAACGGDPDPSATPTDTPAPTSSPATSPPGEPSDEPTADAALEDGRHAVYLHGIDVERRTLTVDVVQFLTGEAAAEAYRADNPGETEGPPNDYYIVNANPRLRTLQVVDDVPVQLVRLQEDSDADLDPGTFEELPDYLAGYQPDDGRLSWNPYWLTVESQVVTAIEEQYIP